MSSRIRRSTAAPRKRSSNAVPWSVLLDALAVLAWGILLLKYWLTGKINILLHPDYVWLTIVAGICLVGLGGLKIFQLLPWGQKKVPPTLPTVQHISLFPPGWSSALLLVVAVFGMQFTPQPFASEVALNRGVTETLAMTRSQPQSFRGNKQSDEKSIIDWVRTLNVYPEPDAYTGQKVRVDGFVLHPPGLTNEYLMISRFVITCCAADVYPVGLPVKLPDTRSTYPEDQWFRVEGEMITETLQGQRQLVIQAKSLTEIPEPKNPYEY